MSQGLNTAFMKDPEDFLGQQYWSIEGAGYNGQQQLRYTLDAHGVGEFDLYLWTAGHHSVSLRNFSEAGFFEKGFLEGAITAYYLPSMTDQNRSMQLLNHAKYFFTDLMNGCTFMAYGQNRLGVTVEHNNAFTNGPASMAPHENNIAGQGHNYFTIYNAATYRQAPMWQGEQGHDIMVTVFGLLKTDGWHFFACRRINPVAMQGRLIAFGAIEI
jgi:hypothetical protein